jgi:hypothetical protein
VPVAAVPPHTIRLLTRDTAHPATKPPTLAELVRSILRQR